MLKKLVEKKNIILIVLAAIFFIQLVLTLIFGNSEDKVMILILSLVIPIVIYAFMKFLFKMIWSNASYEYTKLFICFFSIGAMFFIVSDIAEFILAFPNGLSPTFGVAIALAKATFELANKLIENSEKK